MGDIGVMTRDYRDWLRHEIDKARRARLSRARVDEPTSKRTQYWAEYARRNRKRIRAQQRARRASDV